MASGNWTSVCAHTESRSSRGWRRRAERVQRDGGELEHRGHRRVARLGLPTVGRIGATGQHRDLGPLLALGGQLGREPEELADDPRRQRRGEVRDDVTAAVRGDRVDEIGDDPADVVLMLLHGTRREAASHEPPLVLMERVVVVDRRHVTDNPGS
jgi:hypothetical protein